MIFFKTLVSILRFIFISCVDTLSSLLKRTITLGLSAIIISVIFLSWALFAPNGTRFVVERLHYIPMVDIRASNTGGTFYRGLNADTVQIRYFGGEVQLKALNCRWHLPLKQTTHRLFKGFLQKLNLQHRPLVASPTQRFKWSIQSCTADLLKVVTEGSTDSTPDTIALKPLTLGLDIDIQQLRIQNLLLETVQQNQQTTRIRSLTGKAELMEKHWKIHSLSAQLSNAQIAELTAHAKQVEFTPIPPYALTGLVDFTAETTNSLKAEGTIKVSGNAYRLQLNPEAIVQPPQQNPLPIKAAILMQTGLKPGVPLYLEASLTPQHVQWQTPTGWFEGDIKELRFSGNTKIFQAKLTAILRNQQLAAANLEFPIDWEIYGTPEKIEIQSNYQEQSPYFLALDGQLQWFPNLQIDGSIKGHFNQNSIKANIQLQTPPSAGSGQQNSFFAAKWDIQLPVLNDFIPEARGGFNSQGDISTEFQELNDLNLPDDNLPDDKPPIIHHLLAQLINPTFAITASSKTLGFNETHLNNIQLSLQGTPEKNLLTLQGSHPTLKVNSTFSGGLKSQIEAGQPTLIIDYVSQKLNLSTTKKNKLKSPYKDQQKLQVSASQYDDHWRGGLRWDLSASDYISAKGTFSNTQDISAELIAEMKSLSILQPYISITDKIEGQLKLNALISGNVSENKINGKGTSKKKLSITTKSKLANGQARLLSQGLFIKNIHLSLDSTEANQFTLSGQGQSGNGTLTLNGEADLNHLIEGALQGEHRQQDNFPLKATLDIKGNNLLALNQPDAKIEISPNLKIFASTEGIRAEGEIKIPKAIIQLRDLSKTYDISPDAIIINQDNKDTEKETPKLATQLKVRLGDNIQLSGFGLKTRVEGDVNIRSKQSATPRGFGKLSLVEGTFKKYGQDLKIETGYIEFIGDLSEPIITLKANRTTKHGIATLEVYGDLDTPDTRVYSTPTLSESDAISLLVTGKLLNSTEKSEQGLLVDAAIGLGLKRGNQLLEKLSQSLGVDEISVNAGDTLSESTFTVGKKVGNKLYIKYNQSLFERGNSISLDYELMPNLSLEAESGNESHIDLLYRFERD